MKRIVRLVALAVALFGISDAYAQCTPDNTVDTLIAPTPGPLSDAPLLEPYEEVLTLNVPADTFIIVTNITVDSVVVSNVTGLPPGFTHACDPPSCGFPGGSLGCVSITGTPTDASTIGTTYNLDAQLDLYFATTAPNSSWTDNITDYSITITDSIVSVGDVFNTSQFRVLQNAPNPFSGMTDIVFNAPKPGAYQFRVVDMLGAEVQQQTVSASTGYNLVRFDGSTLPPGFYFYTLGNGEYNAGRRMVITKQ